MTPEAKGLNKEYVLIKEKEKKKYLPGHIVNMMKNKGYVNFSIHWHTQLWKDMEARNPDKHLGTMVEGSWYWYENWVKKVEEHCKEFEDYYK